MAAGVIGEIKLGAGPVAAMPRRVLLSSTTGPASADEVYAATLRQPRTSLMAPVVRTVATGPSRRRSGRRGRPSPFLPSNWWRCVGLVKLATVGDRPADGKQPDVRAHFKLWRRTNPQDDRAGTSGRALGPRAAMLSCLIPGRDWTRGPGTAPCRCRCPGSEI